MPPLRRLLMCCVLFALSACSKGGLSDFETALMYVEGRGVPQDEVEAAKWFRKAADQGIAKAQSSLGIMYEVGRGVPQDDVEAAKWFRKAAEQGDASGRAGLKAMRMLSIDAPQDDVEMARWVRKAADQGSADAQYELGFMYANGKGVPRDRTEAYAWFNISAVSNHKAKEAQDKLDLTPEERERGKKRSTKLFNEIEARKKATGK